MIILVDHNIEGQALLIHRILLTAGWVDLLDIHFRLFPQVGLPVNSTDRTVWRFAQHHQMILLTANRRRREEDALEQVLREENTPSAFPVVTIANIRRATERHYLERCAERLIEIVSEIENYLGIGRIFIP